MANDDHHYLAALAAKIGSTSPAFDEEGHVMKLNLGALHLSALPDELWNWQLSHPPSKDVNPCSA
jgi:hypothetical protein